MQTLTKDTAFWRVVADCQTGDIPYNNPTREKDFYEAWQEVCRKASGEKLCKGILGLGDLRERPSFHSRNLQGLNKGILALLESSKTLLALTGNHDQCDPNWITAMCHPGLEDLTDPSVQEKHGFQPHEILAFNYHRKKEFLELLETQKEKIKKARLILLHQSFREFTTEIKQSHDLSLQTLVDLGAGENHKCLVIAGDIHNYGDYTDGNLTVVSPGSLEMTDSNEGANGLKSSRYPTPIPEFKKYSIKIWKNQDNWEWEREEHPCRPWYYAKADSQVALEEELANIAHESKSWSRPAIITLKTKPDLLETAQESLQKGTEYLTLNVAPLPKEKSEPDELPQTDSPTRGGWKQSKETLLKLGGKSKMSKEAKRLIELLTLEDGNNPSTKADTHKAWETWNEEISEKNKTSQEAQKRNPEQNILEFEV